MAQWEEEVFEKEYADVNWIKAKQMETKGKGKGKETFKGRDKRDKNRSTLSESFLKFFLFYHVDRQLMLFLQY